MHPARGVDQHGRYREVWTDPAVKDVIDRLHNGDPSCGWEGDPNLVLYLEGDGAGGWRWVLERLESDAQYHVVTRARHGQADVRQLPRLLVERDRQRGYDLAAELIAANEKAEAEKEAQRVEALSATLDKVVWYANRDTHGGVHSGPTLRKVRAASVRLGA